MCGNSLASSCLRQHIPGLTLACCSCVLLCVPVTTNGHRPGTQVIFTINGETGKSVSQYSAEWLKTVPQMRSVIKGSKPLSNSDVLVSYKHGGVVGRWWLVVVDWPHID